MNYSDVIHPEVDFDLSNSTTQTNQFDSGHVTWLLACTAVTWLMVSCILEFCFFQNDSSIYITIFDRYQEWDIFIMAWHLGNTGSSIKSRFMIA